MPKHVFTGALKTNRTNRNQELKTCKTFLLLFKFISKTLLAEWGEGEKEHEADVQPPSVSDLLANGF
jgi:hypothetical protein